MQAQLVIFCLFATALLSIFSCVKKKKKPKGGEGGCAKSTSTTNIKSVTAKNEILPNPENADKPSKPVKRTTKREYVLSPVLLNLEPERSKPETETEEIVIKKPKKINKKKKQKWKKKSMEPKRSKAKEEDEEVEQVKDEDLFKPGSTVATAGADDTPLYSAINDRPGQRSMAVQHQSTPRKKVSPGLSSLFGFFDLGSKSTETPGEETELFDALSDDIGDSKTIENVSKSVELESKTPKDSQATLGNLD